MNKTIRLLLILDGFRILGFGLIGPIYAIFVERIGGDVLDAGLAFAVFSVVLGISALIIGRLGDKVKNDVALLFTGYGMLSVGFFAYLLVERPLHLMLVQIILGIGGAFAAVMFDGIFSRYLDAGKFDSEWSVWEAENFIITGVAAIVGALVVKYLGFPTLFIAMGISSLASLVYLYFLYQSVKPFRRSRF